jgi:hypothetical protein
VIVVSQADDAWPHVLSALDADPRSRLPSSQWPLALIAARAIRSWTFSACEELVGADGIVLFAVLRQAARSTSPGGECIGLK